MSACNQLTVIQDKYKKNKHNLILNILFICPQLLIKYFIPGCRNNYYYRDTEIVLIPIAATSKMK